MKNPIPLQTSELPFFPNLATKKIIKRPDRKFKISIKKKCVKILQKYEKIKVDCVVCRIYSVIHRKLEMGMERVSQQWFTLIREI